MTLNFKTDLNNISITESTKIQLLHMVKILLETLVTKMRDNTAFKIPLKCFCNYYAITWCYFVNLLIFRANSLKNDFCSFQNNFAFSP